MIISNLIVLIYFLCSLILLGYGVQCYVLTVLFLRKRKKRLARQREIMKYYYSNSVDKRFPKVVSQIPLYNEKSVVGRVIEAVAAIEYPKDRYEIQVLDDSTDETVQLVNESVKKLRTQGKNIQVIRRNGRFGYKAGALQNALKFTDAEFVAVFDADFVPKPDFLKKSLSFFIQNSSLGLVQGRWAHLNPNVSLITRGQAMGIDGHFMVEQAARCWNGLFMNFNGTAGVFRRIAIDAGGGWQHDTLTEDIDLSYRIQLAGWDAEYVPDIEVPAEIPEDINAFKSQQFRWAKGSIQTARKIIPLLFKKRMKLFTRIQAILHLTYYMVHPFILLLAFLTMPLLHYFKPSIPLPGFVAIVAFLIITSTGPSFMYMVSQFYLGKKLLNQLLMIPVLMLIGTGLAVNNTKAVIEALFRIDSPFHRTPKKGKMRGKVAYRSIKNVTAAIEVAVGLYCLACFTMFSGIKGFLINPFLIIKITGFLFVGILSIIHYQTPELIDFKISSLNPGRK